MAEEVQNTYVFGISDVWSQNKVRLIGYEIFPENIRHFSTIKSIKLWFGTSAEETKVKSLLGIQLMYLNYFTGEKKMTEYQGALLTEDDIEEKELKITDDDYLSKIYIGFKEYITHLKFETKNGESIEVGNYEKEFEINSVRAINEGKNIIVNLRGYKSQKGIRMLGVDFMPYKKFFYNRLIDLFRLRHKLNNELKDKYKTEEEINKLSYEMKCALKLCQLPDAQFSSVIKYL